MKRLLTLALAAILPLAVFAASPKSHDGVVAMSYNIRYGKAEDGTNSWAYRYPATAMMLDDQRPDVVGLQEALDDQFSYLKTALDKFYKGVGVGRTDGKKEGEMTAILYNYKTTSLVKWGTFWLSETPDVPSKGWDAMCYRTATWAILKDKASGKKYFVINTHLDHVGELAQKNGLELLINKIAELNPSGLPVIATGDYNLEPDAPALEAARKALSNARETAVVSDDSHTYHGWGKDKKTIDHIWYKGATCTKFETVTKPYYERKFISDHYPIKATFLL